MIEMNSEYVAHLRGLDVPTTSTFAGSSSLGGATYRSISEKDGKEELSCQMLSFHWKLDLRLDFCWNFRS
jgi:hypothetical protein